MIHLHLNIVVRKYSIDVKSVLSVHPGQYNDVIRSDNLTFPGTKYAHI